MVSHRGILSIPDSAVVLRLPSGISSPPRRPGSSLHVHGVPESGIVSRLRKFTCIPFARSTDRSPARARAAPQTPARTFDRSIRAGDASPRWIPRGRPPHEEIRPIDFSRATRGVRFRRGRKSRGIFREERLATLAELRKQKQEGDYADTLASASDRPARPLVFL